MSKMSASRIVQAAIKIPKRIERGPTDILRALASTVKHIPSEPDSMLQDDPFLMPRKTNDKTIFTLSKISGKNTAKFLLNKHPELFFRDDSEPKIEAFLPPEEFRYDMEFTEDDIKWCINHNDAVNGMIAYNCLEAKNVKLSDSTLLDFFELICFTNEEKILEQIEFQKNFYLRYNDRQLVNLTWKVTGAASKIFNRIKEDLDPPRVYSAMIAGLSKYNEHNTAKQVFEDFKELHPDKGLYVEAYDGIISSIPKLNSSVATAHAAVDEILNHMEQHSVMPSLKVFNSILNCYRMFESDEKICQKAMKFVNDMRSLDIVPSLCTYDSLLAILFKFKISRQHAVIAEEVLNYILLNENCLIVRDAGDVLFLRSCMILFANKLNNLQMANKLHKIYMKNPKLFLNNGQKQVYLDVYFRLIVTTDKLENILNFYDMYVPMNFRPSVDTYNALAEVLDLYKADDETVKRIGIDLVEFRLADKVNDAIFKKYPDYVDALEKSLVK